MKYSVRLVLRLAWRTIAVLAVVVRLLLLILEVVVILLRGGVLLIYLAWLALAMLLRTCVGMARWMWT